MHMPAVVKSIGSWPSDVEAASWNLPIAGLLPPLGTALLVAVPFLKNDAQFRLGRMTADR